MKIKAFVPVSFFLLILCFFSCAKEDVKGVIDNNGYDSSMIVGAWYRSFGNYMEDISFTNNLRFKGNVFEQNSTSSVVVDTFSGNWGVAEYGKQLYMNTYRSSSGDAIIDYYLIVNCNDYSLQLKNKENGATLNYIRIVEIAELSVDEEYEIDCLKNNTISVYSCNSTNTSIAEMDSNGYVKANGIGVAFITLSTNMGEMIIKIEVK